MLGTGSTIVFLSSLGARAVVGTLAAYASTKGAINSGEVFRPNDPLRFAGIGTPIYTARAHWRTKATLIYRRTGNLRAVQLLLGHTKIESTVWYLSRHRCELCPRNSGAGPRLNVRGRANLRRDKRCLLFRSLSGAKRTFHFAPHMSAFDPKRTSQEKAPQLRHETQGTLVNQCCARQQHQY
jgi:hypothetical protein